MSGKLEGKAKLNVNVAYKNGSALYQDRPVPAMIDVTKVPRVPYTVNTTEFSAVNIQMIVPSSSSEEFYEALMRGKVELSIEGVPSKVERDSCE